MDFKLWCEGFKPKPWKSKKEDVIKFWHDLPPSIPILPIKIVPRYYKGPTYRFDGVRVTGSHQFINSIMARLKDMLPYESQRSRLHTAYRQQINKKTEEPVPNSFVFYVQIRDREKHKR